MSEQFLDRRALKTIADQLILANLRVVTTFQNLEGRPRESSFPFISGDTYRAFAARYFDLEFYKRFTAQATDLPTYPEEKSAVIFVENILLRDLSARELFLSWVKLAPLSAEYRIVFANGDDPPDLELRKQVIDLGHWIFSHNLQDGEERSVPIPLGLQNLTHRKFGVLDDYLLLHDRNRHDLRRQARRSHSVFASFSVDSNVEARAPLADLLGRSRFGVSLGKMSVREYRRRVLNTMFIPSPAGLGPDCYRTWEAIYLGAVPVLLKGTIAESITSGAPIWVVDSWEELINASDDELLDRFSSIRAVGNRKALFPYWSSAISGQG